MTDYSQLDELRHVYLEDSWVLDVIARPGLLAISLDFVLLPGNRDYADPLPGEQYCYRRGELRFEGVRELKWTGQGKPPAQDASGELDYGSVDSFSVEADVYLLSGGFGEIALQAEMMRVSY